MYYFIRKICLLCLLFKYSAVFSQDAIHIKRFQYFGLHQVGLLAGSSMEKAGILTTNGIRFGNWYTGVSTGIDWYGVRSIPLLADVHKAFGKGRHQPFVYGNAGVGFVWQGDDAYYFGNGYTNYHYRKGFCGEAGLGYFISLKNKTALSLSTGFSYKEIGIYEEKGSGGIAGPLFSNFQYKYYYRRITIRIGIKI